MFFDNVEDVICRIQVARGDLVSRGDERLERHDLAPFLEIEKLARQAVVEFGSESLVVHQDHVGLLEHSMDGGILEEIATLEMDVTDLEPPEPATRLELVLLEFREHACVLHDLAAPTLASYLERSLQHHVTDPGTEINETVTGAELGDAEDLGHELRQQFTVDVVGAVLVLTKRRDPRGDDPSIGLGQDALNEPQIKYRKPIHNLTDETAFPPSDHRIIPIRHQCSI